MNIQIRPAKKTDYESVIKIMSQVQDMHVEWRPDIYKHNDNLIPQNVFEKIVENGTFYVAESDNSVVGVLEIAYRHVESSSHVTRDFIFVDTMAIDENYRRLGIGHKMFDFIKELKQEKNLDGIELQVNARNSAAYEMYKKYGFTEKSINMELLD
jgi:ribosomal protein S18 acetylase RimI-like enzyme